MDWIVPNEGKKKILDEVYRLTSAREAFVLDQWLTGGPVDDDSTASDFVFATYTGYAQVAVARADWGAATETSDVGQIAKTTNPVFTCTGGSPQTVAGLILRGATSGIIYAGCNYSPTISMANGATDTVNPLKVSDKTFA